MVSRPESQKDEALAQLTIVHKGAHPEEIVAFESVAGAAAAQLDKAREENRRARHLLERGVGTAF
ncbi:MAG: hypothetical protein ACR2PF_11015 [Rhizobiaceae bacterium]